MLTTPSESEQQKQTIEIARGQCKSTLGVGDSEEKESDLGRLEKSVR